MMWYKLQTKMMSGIWEDMWKMLQDEPLQRGVQSSKNIVVLNMEKEADHE